MDNTSAAGGLAGKMQPPGAGSQPGAAGGAPQDAGFWNWLQGLFEQHQQNQPGGSQDASAAAPGKKPADMGGVDAVPIS